MKHVTHIIFCMLCMLCLFDATAVAQVNSSDEFFTLYFKDGTSRNFYTGDITAITHSNIDLDGTIYEEPVVQEIRMGTEVERYRLADIEEMSFERLNIPFDVRAYMKEWDDIHVVVDELFKECKDIESLNQYKDEIMSLPSVKDVTFDIEQGVMWVTLDDDSRQSWMYSLVLDGNYDEEEYEESYSAMAEHLVKKLATRTADGHITGNGKTVWIGDALYDDEHFNGRDAKYMKELEKKLHEAKFNVMHTTEWYDSWLQVSDIVFFHGHGYYNAKDNLHWINTGKILNTTQVSRIRNGEGEFGTSFHEGKTATHLIISEDYLGSEKIGRLKEHSVIYMAACSTLKENDRFANVFLNKGAAAYIGYDTSAYLTACLGSAFVYQLSKDKTIEDAFNYICNTEASDYEYPNTGISESLYILAGKHYIPSIRYNKKTDNPQNVCYNHCEFSTAKPEECNIGETSAYLGVKIQNLDGLKNKYDGLQEIGILYSTRSYGWQDSDVKKITIYSWKWKDGLMLGQAFNLKMETEYYYRAYVKTGDGEIIYGDIEKFVTRDEEARAELKKIYDQIGLESWGWFKPNTPVDKWSGVWLSEDGYHVYCYEARSIEDLELKDLKRISEISLPSNIGVFETVTILNCPNLKELSNYKTKHLEVQSCYKLTNLFTWTNTDYFETIDLSDCSNIQEIIIGFTDLRSLRVANCSSLKTISISETKLSSIEVVNCPNLEKFNCRDNEIKGTLNLSSDKLREINCGDNKISSLNLRCPLLEKLDCYNNEITGTLNLSNSPKLEEVYCAYNNITRVKITSHNMSSLDCSETLVDQSYESIPNWEDVDYFIGPEKYAYKYIYTEADDFTEEEKKNEGWTELSREPTLYYYHIYYYKYNYDDHHGFYHEGEPNDEKYWPFH